MCESSVCLNIGPATMPSSGVSGRNQSFTDQSASISRMLACYGQQQLNL